LVVQGVGQSDTNMHIKVCFTKAGFMSQGVIEIDSDSEEKTRIAELVPPSLSLITFKITFEDFVKIDDNVITTEEITDQDNCKRVQTVWFIQ